MGSLRVMGEGEVNRSLRRETEWETHNTPAPTIGTYLRGVSTCASASALASALTSASSIDSVLFLLCVSTSALALALTSLCYQSSH